MATSIIKTQALESVSCSKVGNTWTSGNMTLFRKGKVVQCTGSPTLTETTERTTFATIPEGFRPPANIYARSNVGLGAHDYYIFNANGNVQTGGAQSAGAKYFSAVWVTN